MKNNPIFRIVLPLLFLGLVWSACSKDDNLAENRTDYETLAILDESMSALFNGYKRFFPNIRAVSVSEALTMSMDEINAADRIVFFSSLGEQESSLSQLWESRLKAVRNKSILLLAVGENATTDEVVAHTGVHFGSGFYLKAMAPAGNVYFFQPEKFDEAKFTEALDSLYDHMELRATVPGDAPQISSTHYQLQKLYTGSRAATISPYYTVENGDFTFNSNDVDKIAIMLDVQIDTYSYPGSTDRYAVVNIRGAGIQCRLDMNNGDVLKQWYHTGTSYLPANQLSSQTVTNSQGIGMSFDVGKSVEAGLNYNVSQTVTYSQKDFQTVATALNVSGNEASMSWKVRAQNINNNANAWEDGGISDKEQYNYLNVSEIVYTEIPVSPKSAFMVKQDDLPQLYSLFAPQMTTTLYTTSPKLQIVVEGGVRCQHTASTYNLGALWLGGNKYNTDYFYDARLMQVNFGNTVCLMDE